MHGVKRIIEAIASRTIRVLIANLGIYREPSDALALFWIWFQFALLPQLESVKRPEAASVRDRKGAERSERSRGTPQASSRTEPLHSPTLERRRRLRGTPMPEVKIATKI